MKFHLNRLVGEIILDISYEWSVLQMGHIKCQVLISLKSNKINFRLSSATNLLTFEGLKQHYRYHFKSLMRDNLY